ncbi:MAG TPA: helix-turn-helix domain-containing protein [Thermomicrobiales bacterium]|nr:helix-turn-helix domain-containing protein [Thermomicrobiales bacterium]
MSATADGVRRRDAAATRQSLLDAARELFGTRGFEATTLREIGDRAGADPALIARYFGSKADLFSQAMAAETLDRPPTETFVDFDATVAYLIDYVDRRRGPGPMMQALMRLDAGAEAQEEAAAHMRRRFVEPLVGALRERGVDQPELRAEAAFAALLGIIGLRATGLFDALRASDTADLTAFVQNALRGVLGPSEGVDSSGG